jgi:hypothetical protein
MIPERANAAEEIMGKGKMMLRRKEVSSVVLRPMTPGCRAVFLVEVRSPEERRKVQELFSALAELGEVAPLCDGPMMAYAVQLRAEGNGVSPTQKVPDSGSPNRFFTKIEAVLKEEFAFSLVEQSFNEVVYQLVESLCEDSGGEMHAVPRCGICNEPEPFPTRVTMRDATGRGIIEACYCARCAAQQADPSDKQFLVGLLSADRRDFRVIREVELIEWPAETEADVPLPTYRIAS